jgi:hypothetical protein
MSAAKRAGATAVKRAAKTPAKGTAKVAAKVAAKGGARAAKSPPPRTAPMRRVGERPEPVVLTGRGGARVWGAKHPAAQLTERQVIRFRKLVRDGRATVGELATETGCGHSRISMAVRGQTWRHLNEVAPPVG